jgi:hypothetical protein
MVWNNSGTLNFDTSDFIGFTPEGVYVLDDNLALFILLISSFNSLDVLFGFEDFHKFIAASSDTPLSKHA